MTDKEFTRIVSYVMSNYGIDLSKKKTIVAGKLNHYIMEKGFNSYDQYMDYVEKDITRKESQNLVNILTTNHTYFMREFDTFEIFRDEVLPEMKLMQENTHDLRIWSAASSSGEEPYTIAMIVKDFLGMEYKDWDTTILATDISMKVLNSAVKGIYTKDQIEPLPERWKKNNFVHRGNNNYEVVDEIKAGVIFRQFNLMNQLPFKKKLQMVFLRNVMIYFNEETKIELINKIYDCMEPGGYLFIGSTESIDKDATKFKYYKPSIYRR